MPGCFVATTEFQQAAEVQASALGFEPAMVWVDHPIQNRSEAELESMADEAFGAVLKALGG